MKTTTIVSGDDMLNCQFNLLMISHGFISFSPHVRNSVPSEGERDGR